ncbi:MAG: hypothetical protein HYS04_19590 [Acidobacteria bacterium]|nr:hypothetical protein [Acidobacteriota bacterium]
MTERTLAIIKPDAVGAGNAGAILALVEQTGFRILGLKRLRLSQAQAESIERNAVHGSDAPETAAFEVPFFFSTAELL